MNPSELSFSTALALIQQGNRVGRREWKNARCVFLVDGSTFNVSRAPLLGIFPEGTEIKYRPHIDMIGADGSVGTWSPSMVDILACDWYEVTD